MFKLSRVFERSPRASKVSMLGLISGLAMGLALMGSAAQAEPWYSSGYGCSGLVNLSVFDRAERRELTVYNHRGQAYVAGTPGREYALRLRNCTPERVLVVVSVDGVNVITGENASANQSGYVLDPHGSVDIQGWRKSMNNTAAFYFSDPSQAYATKTDRPFNLGVIGAAVFTEKARVRVYENDELYSQRAPGAAAPAAKSESAGRAAAEADASLGTGHGRKEYNPATRVEFERASKSPSQWISVRYEKRETLVARGIIPKPKRPRPSNPNPFPGDEAGFVPDP
jgi:hypothetical protein